MSDRYVPVAYDPQKAPKSKIDYRKLYKIDILGFDPIIGHITNVSTTLYEMQSEYSPDSPEYQEIDNRLKLCCSLQSKAIDSTKGIAFEGIPRHWLRRTRITEEMCEELSESELAAIEFNNRICIESRRPYFMRYLYPHKNREYKEFQEDLSRSCVARWGKRLADLSEKEKNAEDFSKICEYNNRFFPLLETSGTMNRICRYMESEVKEIKAARTDLKDEEGIFDILYDGTVPTDLSLVEKMVAQYSDYNDFCREHQLEDSEFNSYDQFYARVRRDCLENISNNIQECANLAVYVCYKLNSTKSKDFCWNCFGEGIYQNLKQKAVANGLDVRIPQRADDGSISYLGKKYSMQSVNLEDRDDADF